MTPTERPLPQRQSLTRNGAIPVAGSSHRALLVRLSIIALLLAALYAWDSRYEGDPDGVSYLNIAEQVLHGQIGALANPYWSPLYPLLNAALLAIFRPSPENLLPMMHGAGLVMFACALAGFVFFLNQWLRVTAPPHGDAAPGRARAITFWSWCVFLWVSLRLVSVIYPLPDMLTFAALLFAAGLCCRVALPDPRPRHYALLGLVLGIGYIGKFSVAPVACLLFVLLFAFSTNRARDIRRIGLAAAVFCLVAAPEVAAVSRRVGKLSFGEAGRLNYAWHVNQTPFLWNGPGGFAAGQTHVRVLNAQPLVFEYADPNGGTLPVWYDPAYWQSGLKTRIDLRQITVSISRRLLETFRIFEDAVPLLVGLVVLLAAEHRRRVRIGASPALPLLGAWAALSCSVFLFVHIEFRYIATAIFLLTLAAYAFAERAAQWRAFRLVTPIVGVVLLIPLLAPTERALTHLAQAAAGHPQRPEHAIVAAQLGELGIRPGDHIAVAGNAEDDYYALTAGVQISAQVCDAEAYAEVDWHDPQISCRAAALFARPPEFLDPAWDALRRAGVKAVMTRDIPRDLPPGWRRIADHYAIHMLDPAARSSAQGATIDALRWSSSPSGSGSRSQPSSSSR